MDIFDTFATNEQAELDGVWEPYSKGTRVKLARLGNKNYTRMLTKEIEAAGAALEAQDDAADKLSDKIMAKVLATTVLVGIEGFTYQKQPLSDSLEDRAKVLMHKDFRKDVMERAAKIDRFKAKSEEQQGNA